MKKSVLISFLLISFLTQLSAQNVNAPWEGKNRKYFFYEHWDKTVIDSIIPASDAESEKVSVNKKLMDKNNFEGSNQFSLELINPNYDLEEAFFVGDTVTIFLRAAQQASYSFFYSVNLGKDLITIAENIPSFYGDSAYTGAFSNTVRNNPGWYVKYDWVVPDNPSFYVKLIYKVNDHPALNSFPVYLFSSDPTYSYAIIRPTNEWSKIKTISNKSLINMHFVDERNGWICGEEGRILRTRNGGFTWEEQRAPVSSDLTNIIFDNQMEGICWNDLVLLKTNDGGINWQIKSDLEKLQADKIQFIDTKRGWYVTSDYTDSSSLYRTDNSGMDWQLINKTFYEYYGGYELFDFVDRNVGFKWQSIEKFYKRLFSTNDGGESWSIVEENTIPELSFPSFNFYTKDIGIRSLWKSYDQESEYAFPEFTKDGGKSWESSSTPTYFSLVLEDSTVWSSSGKKVDIITENGKSEELNYKAIMKSADWGDHWDITYLMPVDDYNNVNRMYSRDGKVVWAVCDNGYIMKYGQREINPMDWSASIKVEDSPGNIKILTFGQDDEAGEGLDESLGEKELPPPPPANVFDARLILPSGTASEKDLRSLSEEEIVWQVNFQTVNENYPVEFSWNPEELGAGGFYLEVEGDSTERINLYSRNSYMLQDNRVRSVKIIFNKGSLAKVNVEKGWNLVSVPVELEDNQYSSIFPSSENIPYGFNTKYEQSEYLFPGRGYWLKMPTDHTLFISGDKYTGPVEIKEGWNLVGFNEEEIAVGNIMTEPENIIVSDIFGFSEGYYETDLVEPGKGYWIKSASDGEIILNNGSSKPLAKKPSIDSAMIEFDFIVSDGVRDSLVLRVGIDSLATDDIDISLGESELPPFPPLGVFDARLQIPNTNYTSTKDYRSYGGENNISKEHKLIYQLSDSSKGLRLKWDLPDIATLNIRDGINGTIFNEDFENGHGEYTIDNTEIQSAILTINYNFELTGITGRDDLPKSYALYQNYPNPFNPSTTIRFDLPRESNVRLEVFNILGERISELVNEEMKAGEHKVNFNASSLSSGIYLYRISAGDYIQTRKFVLMK